MESINSFLNRLFSPLYNYVHFFLRLTLGISFFLHGYGKFKFIEGFSNFLEAQGIIYPNFMTYLVAWGEILSGIGIITGGLLIKKLPVAANLLTRLSLNNFDKPEAAILVLANIINPEVSLSSL